MTLQMSWSLRFLSAHVGFLLPPPSAQSSEGRPPAGHLALGVCVGNTHQVTTLGEDGVRASEARLRVRYRAAPF